MSASFAVFVLFKEIFINIWVLSQCIADRINFQNIYTFTYQKMLLHTLLLLVFKIVESLKSTLKNRFSLLKKTILYASIKAL